MYALTVCGVPLCLCSAQTLTDLRIHQELQLFELLSSTFYFFLLFVSVYEIENHTASEYLGLSFWLKLKHSDFTLMHLCLSSYRAEQICICSYLLVSWTLHAVPSPLKFASHSP